MMHGHSYMTPSYAIASVWTSWRERCLPVQKWHLEPGGGALIIYLPSGPTVKNSWKYFWILKWFHPWIKFAAKLSPKSVTFLDTKITVDNQGHFNINLYVKLTDTHQHFHRGSCHPGDCKRSIPYSQALKFCPICSGMPDCLKKKQKLTEFLTNQGYEKNFVYHRLIDQRTQQGCVVLLQSKKTTITRSGNRCH